MNKQIREWCNSCKKMRASNLFHGCLCGNCYNTKVKDKLKEMDALELE